MTDEAKTTARTYRQTGRSHVAAKLGKGAMTLAVAAVATYGALKPEEVARQAIVANTISHKALAKKVDELQTWVKSNRETAASATEACQAKVEALTSFVSGYLTALNRPTNGRQRNAETTTSAEVKALVKALGGGAKRPRAVQRALPKLAPVLVPSAKGHR